MTTQFTTPCFIWKNTPGLREKLEQMGYETLFPRIGDYIGTYLDSSRYIVFKIKPNSNHNGHDCGANEALFLDLAGMRSDTDYMQKFTDGKDWYTHLSEDNDNKFDQNRAFLERMKLNGFHKATAAEIIEWHKKKGE